MRRLFRSRRSATTATTVAESIFTWQLQKLNDQLKLLRSDPQKHIAIIIIRLIINDFKNNKSSIAETVAVLTTLTEALTEDKDLAIRNILITFLNQEFQPSISIDKNQTGFQTAVRFLRVLITHHDELQTNSTSAVLSEILNYALSIINRLIQDSNFLNSILAAQRKQCIEKIKKIIPKIGPQSADKEKYFFEELIILAQGKDKFAQKFRQDFHQIASDDGCFHLLLYLALHIIQIGNPDLTSPLEEALKEAILDGLAGEDSQYSKAYSSGEVDPFPFAVMHYARQVEYDEKQSDVMPFTLEQFNLLGVRLAATDQELLTAAQSQRLTHSPLTSLKLAADKWISSLSPPNSSTPTTPSDEVSHFCETIKPLIERLLFNRPFPVDSSHPTRAPQYLDEKIKILLEKIFQNLVAPGKSPKEIHLALNQENDIIFFVRRLVEDIKKSPSYSLADHELNRFLTALKILQTPNCQYSIDDYRNLFSEQALAYIDDIRNDFPAQNDEHEGTITLKSAIATATRNKNTSAEYQAHIKEAENLARSFTDADLFTADFIQRMKWAEARRSFSLRYPAIVSRITELLTWEPYLLSDCSKRQLFLTTILQACPKKSLPQSADSNANIPTDPTQSISSFFLINLKSICSTSFQKDFIAQILDQSDLDQLFFLFFAFREIKVLKKLIFDKICHISMPEHSSRPHPLPAYRPPFKYPDVYAMIQQSTDPAVLEEKTVSTTHTHNDQLSGSPLTNDDLTKIVGLVTDFIRVTPSNQSGGDLFEQFYKIINRKLNYPRSDTERDHHESKSTPPDIVYVNFFIALSIIQRHSEDGAIAKTLQGAPQQNKVAFISNLNFLASPNSYNDISEYQERFKSHKVLLDYIQWMKTSFAAEPLEKVAPQSDTAVARDRHSSKVLPNQSFLRNPLERVSVPPGPPQPPTQHIVYNV